MSETKSSEENKTSKKKKSIPDTGRRPSKAPHINHELHAFIIYVLRKYASDLSPLAPKDVLAKLAVEASSIGFSGEENKLNITVKTIREHLNTMTDFCNNDATHIFEDIYLGKMHRYHIRDDYEKRKRIYPESQTAPDYLSREVPEYKIVSRYAEENELSELENNDYDGSNAKTFYSFTPMFSAQELLLLQSCVETNPYITQADSKNIIDKIRRLSLDSIYEKMWRQKSNRSSKELAEYNQKKSSFSSSQEKQQGRLMENLTELVYHMELEHQIIIKYGMYNLKGKLVCKRYSKDGKPMKHILDPVSVLWANGFCYLVAHTPKSKAPDDVIVYRVDRIMSIEPSYIPGTNKIVLIDDDVADYKENFDSLKFLKQHPVMYSGKTEHISMLVKDSESFPIANPLFDTFGRSIEISNIPDGAARQYLHCSRKELEEKGETWYLVKLTHSVDGTILWAKQHIDIARIISPDHVVQALTDSVRKGLARYQ